MSELAAITRAVGASLGDCELTFLPRDPIDVARAGRQHADYCAALRAAGIAVEVLPADPTQPDGVFVEDVAVVLDELAVLARPAPRRRQLEVSAVARALAKHRALARIAAPGTLEGGDVLRIGRQIFVGISSRTNEDGFAQLAAIAQEHGYEVAAVPVTGCLHLKTAVTAIDHETLLIHPSWVDAAKLRGFAHVRVPPSEPFAANALALGNAIAVSARSVETRRLLESRGYATLPLDISELAKAEGGLTCLSIVFAPRAVLTSRSHAP